MFVETISCDLWLLIVAELDSSNPKLINDSRIMRIARGSGRQVREVMEMFEEYKRLAKIWSKMKGLKPASSIN